MLMKVGDDYSVLGLHVDNKQELVVASHFLSYSKEWPSSIDYNGKTYAFDGQTVMPECYIGHYFSMALYLEREPVAVSSTDTAYGQR